MSKKLFITGSEGFVGSHLVELLVKKNYNIKALVQYNSFNNLGWLNKVDKKIVNEIDIVLGDVRDKEFLEKNTRDCDKIIHLAALIGIPYSYHAPRSYIDVNVTGTLNLLEIAKKKILKNLYTHQLVRFMVPQNTFLWMNIILLTHSRHTQLQNHLLIN